MSDLQFETCYKNNQNKYRYPTEFVIRTLSGAKYPGLNYPKCIQAGEKILDLGFGDGRNIGFLNHLGLNVSGIEVTQAIVNEVQQYWQKNNITANLKVGRNSDIPFSNQYFDYILSSGSCYYVDKTQTFSDNLREIARVLKPGGTLIANVPTLGNFIVEAGELLPDEYVLVNNDPYQLRNGQLLKYFSNENSLQDYFSEHMENFSFGCLNDDYFGIQMNAILLTCTKRK